MRKFLISTFLILLLSPLTILKAQGIQYKGPEDPAGDIAATREGWMDGNRVLLYFKNNAELSRWPKQGSLWPNNYDGVQMLDGIGLLIGGRVYIEKDDDPSSIDSIPVTDPGEITLKSMQGKIDTLFYLQTSYREEMDTDPTGTIEWGLYPTFEYFSPESENPAMSDEPSTWPANGWPGQGRTKKWAGEWNGRFGRGVKYADLETFFVLNDAQDQEYLGPEDRSRYYPRPGHYIGDVRPDVTIQDGKPWGGLGLRVAVRGFQWNNPQARDAIFWEYNISNVSDYTIRDICFGYWVDNGIGDSGSGGEDDELGYFDRLIDMAYSWDIDGVGQGGLTPGIMGFAYLESPGKPYNSKDDDLDGLVDEKRDNPAGEIIGPEAGISDLENFLSFYHLDRKDLKEHYAGDEDQDWTDGIDLNNNGRYDPGEDAGDDVGLDGKGPNDIDYPGPDQGECDHMPSYKEGVGCEPNFAATDVSESDMVGLTSFMLFPIPPHRPPYTRWFRNDKSLYNIMNQDSLIAYLGNISNLVELFASGPFPLYKGRTERISMSELHAYDPLEGLTEENGYQAPALFQQKEIVQVIYEKDYRFASPPEMPTLTATPKNGKVILTWDNRADTKTRDPFLMNVNDFQGYKLFRSTDKKFQDSESITDGYGTPMFKKPIFQCDIKDNTSGFTDFGLVNGMGYNLGNDSGIKHYFVDENVQNGRTYYYAIVAYDSGAPGIGPGIAPSENNIILELDEAEDITSTSPNVAIVSPHQYAAGYVPDEIEMTDTSNIMGAGSIAPEIMANKALQSGREYAVTFGVRAIETVDNYSHGMNYVNDTIKVLDCTDGSIIYEETPDNFFGTNLISDEDLGGYYLNTSKTIQTDVFHGMRLNINTPVITPEFDYAHSGWVTGNGDIDIRTTPESNKFPWDYDIIFGDETDVLYTGAGVARRVMDADGSRIRRDILNDVGLPFKVINKSFLDSTGSYEILDMVVHDQNQNGVYDISSDKVFAGPLDQDGKWAGTVLVLNFSDTAPEDMPEDGDEYHITFQRPFWSTDTIKFKPIINDSLDNQKLKHTMDDIKVVPNPYIATNKMEPAVKNPYLNQKRQIMFTHVPAQCEIKIFTSSGILVDEFQVSNSSENGVAHWDLQSREGLDIAAGVYMYHIKSSLTNDVKMGKFAIIK
ncbi:MAG: hypothetical protein K9M80_01125 [Candidatus Marinimicrobia bacterium]|nr:hypothetical protein [Candidatus Neomarinimicrobiota bacterium]